ncbi:MAG: thermonuclease family protein [Verrucomicrobiales bacterium]
MAKQSTWPFLLLLLVAGGLWLKDQLSGVGPLSSSVGETVAGWERIEGCRWVSHDRNDGDSFRLKIPDGRVLEFRLYFVDAPESAFRTYGGGRSNHARIADQADAFGIDSSQAVEIGKRAKDFVEDLLASRDLTIFTRWDDPFGDERYHAYVHLDGHGSEMEWLHERLVEQGLVRIHTKGSSLPDGTSQGDQTDRLRALQAVAKEQGLGGWERPRMR